MALETVVFQQDPFTSSFECKDLYTTDDLLGAGGVFSNEVSTHFNINPQSHNINNNNVDEHYMIHTDDHQNSTASCWISPDHDSSSIVRSYIKEYSSPEEFSMTGADKYPPPATVSHRRKRRRLKASKNKEEVENQRMTHIAVERNRRRQMNDYLALLRSLMPPSYAQRGDQASIVGGAINYVKELEQQVEYLEYHKQKMKQQIEQDDYLSDHDDPLIHKFFTFPQYSTISCQNNNSSLQSSSQVADIQVTMVESHANIKVLSKRQPKQLFKMVSGFQSIGLVVLHLNITTVDHRVLYSFNLKVEDDCQLSTVNEIATSVHEMLVMIKEEAIFC